MNSPHGAFLNGRDRMDTSPLDPAKVRSCSTCYWWRPVTERRWMLFRVQAEDQFFSKCAHPKCAMMVETGFPEKDYADNARTLGACGKKGKFWEAK